MKIPQIFIPDNPKEININNFKRFKNSKKRADNLENLILKNVLGYEKREEHNTSHGNCVLKGGVDIKSLKKTAVIRYNFNRIVLLQYKTETDLLKNLRSVFENGFILYSGNKLNFFQRFLFKDNISIYLEGDKKFTKELQAYYRSLGFKHLDYELKAV